MAEYNDLFVLSSEIGLLNPEYDNELLLLSSEIGLINPEFYTNLVDRGNFTGEFGLISANWTSEIFTLTSEFGLVHQDFYNDFPDYNGKGAFESQIVLNTIEPPENELFELTSEFQLLNMEVPHDLLELSAEFVLQADYSLYFNAPLFTLSSEFAIQGASFYFDADLNIEFTSEFTLIREPINELFTLSSEIEIAAQVPIKFDAELFKLGADFRLLRENSFYFDAELFTLTSGGGSVTFDATLFELNSTIIISDAALAASTATYSFNIENDAIATYSNWGFVRLVRFKGAALGIKNSTLYSIGAANDDGANIAAVGASHFSEFADGHLTRTYALYINLITDGAMNFGVMPNAENHYKYRMPLYKRSSMQVKRQDIGRGLIGNEFAFTFENVSGSNFFIQSVRFLPKEQAPRI